MSGLKVNCIGDDENNPCNDQVWMTHTSFHPSQTDRCQPSTYQLCLRPSLDAIESAVPFGYGTAL